MSKTNKNKINFKQFIPSIICSVFLAILITYLLYLAITDGNEAFVNLLNSIKENNNANEVIKIFFPIILIISLMYELGKYVVTIGKNKEKETK